MKSPDSFLAHGQGLFFVWVTLSEHDDAAAVPVGLWSASYAVRWLATCVRCEACRPVWRLLAAAGILIAALVLAG